MRISAADQQLCWSKWLRVRVNIVVCVWTTESSQMAFLFPSMNFLATEIFIFSVHCHNWIYFCLATPTHPPTQLKILLWEAVSSLLVHRTSSEPLHFLLVVLFGYWHHQLVWWLLPCCCLNSQELLFLPTWLQIPSHERLYLRHVCIP